MAQSKWHHYKPKEINNVERLNLLAKFSWNYKDVCNYFQMSDRKASEIIKDIKSKYGIAPYTRNSVLVENLLAEFGTTRLKEIEIISNVERAINND